eukprot:jgi/Botrbrau1/10838/Bobra.0025s0017.1
MTCHPQLMTTNVIIIIPTSPNPTGCFLVFFFFISSETEMTLLTPSCIMACHKCNNVFLVCLPESQDPTRPRAHPPPPRGGGESKVH